VHIAKSFRNWSRSESIVTLLAALLALTPAAQIAHADGRIASSGRAISQTRIVDQTVDQTQAGCLAAFQAQAKVCFQNQVNDQAACLATQTAAFLNADNASAVAYGKCDNIFNATNTGCLNTSYAQAGAASVGLAAALLVCTLALVAYPACAAIAGAGYASTLAGVVLVQQACTANAAAVQAGCYANADLDRKAAKANADAAYNTCINNAAAARATCDANNNTTYNNCVGNCPPNTLQTAN